MPAADKYDIPGYNYTPEEGAILPIQCKCLPGRHDWQPHKHYLHCLKCGSVKKTASDADPEPKDYPPGSNVVWTK
jgi:hypothetical protein